MIRSVLISIISRGSAAVMNLGTMVILSRYLGAEGKGITSKLIVLIVGIQVIADFMGGAALVYLSARHHILRLLTPAWGWAFLCSVSAGIFFYNQPEGLLFGWHLPALAFLCISLNQHIHLLNGRTRFNQANMLTILQAILTFGTTWYFLVRQPDTGAYLYGLYAGWGVPWIISLYLLFKLPSANMLNTSNISGIRQLFQFGSANQLGHLIQYFTQRISFYVLPVFALGIYSNAVTLSESLWMFASSVAVVQYGYISNSNNKYESAELSLLLMKLVLLVTATGGCILCLLPAQTYTFVFGNDFAGVAQVLPILYPGICAMSVYLIAGHFFSGTGQFKKNNYALLSGLLISIAGYLLLLMTGKDINMNMVAWVTTLSNCAIFFSVLWLFKKETAFELKNLLPGKKDIRQFKKLLTSGK